jgi:hypothetical protein
MCEEQVVGLQSVLRSLATKVPRIILKRAEEVFPAVRESMVSVLCTIQVGRSHSVHVRMRISTKIWTEPLKKRDSLGDLCADGRVL